MAGRGLLVSLARALSRKSISGMSLVHGQVSIHFEFDSITVSVKKLERRVSSFAAADAAVLPESNLHLVNNRNPHSSEILGTKPKRIGLATSNHKAFYHRYEPQRTLQSNCMYDLSATLKMDLLISFSQVARGALKSPHHGLVGLS